MKTSLFPFLFLVVLLTASCSPALSEAEMTATQEALVSSTPTLTNTPTVTHTLPPTLTPTITRTPTVTPVQVEVEIQDNGRTLVKNYVYRVQFELPAGWTFTPSHSGLGSANYDNGAGSSVRLSITIDDTNTSAEEFMDTRAFEYRVGFDFTVNRKGSTSQGGFQLAYLEMSGEYNSERIHNYWIFLRSRGVLVEFAFSGDIDTARTAINQIQASIQQTPYQAP